MLLHMILPSTNLASLLFCTFYRTVLLFAEVQVGQHGGRHRTPPCAISYSQNRKKWPLNREGLGGNQDFDWGLQNGHVLPDQNHSSYARSLEKNLHLHGEDSSQRICSACQFLAFFVLVYLSNSHWIIGGFLFGDVIVQKRRLEEQRNMAKWPSKIVQKFGDFVLFFPWLSVQFCYVSSWELGFSVVPSHSAT